MSKDVAAESPKGIEMKTVSEGGAASQAAKKLVPLEPTDAMHLAGAFAVRMDTTALNRAWTARQVWLAMYEAAPDMAALANQQPNPQPPQGDQAAALSDTAAVEALAELHGVVIDCNRVGMSWPRPESTSAS